MNRSGTALSVLLCSLACWLFAVGSANCQTSDDESWQPCWHCPQACPEHAEFSDANSEMTPEEGYQDESEALASAEEVADEDADLEATAESSPETSAEESDYENWYGHGYTYEDIATSESASSIPAESTEPVVEEEYSYEEGWYTPASEAVETESDEYEYYTSLPEETDCTDAATEEAPSAPADESAYQEPYYYSYGYEYDSSHTETLAVEQENAAEEMPSANYPREYEAEYQYDAEEYWTSRETSETEADQVADEMEASDISETQAEVCDEASSDETYFSDEMSESYTDDEEAWTVPTESTQHPEEALHSEPSDLDVSTDESEMWQESAMSEEFEASEQSEMYDESEMTDESESYDEAEMYNESESYYESEATEESEMLETSESEYSEDFAAESWTVEEAATDENCREFDYENHNEYYDVDALSSEADETWMSDIAAPNAESEETVMETESLSDESLTDDSETAASIPDETAAMEMEEETYETATFESEPQVDESETTDVDEPIDPVIPDAQDAALIWERLQQRLLQTAAEAFGKARIQLADMAEHLRNSALAETFATANLVPADEAQR